MPDTLITLTKEDFVVRALAIHAVEPIRKLREWDEELNQPVNPVDLDATIVLRDVELTTEEEVRSYAEEWYDNYVAMNLAEEAGS